MPGGRFDLDTEDRAAVVAALHEPAESRFMRAARVGWKLLQAPMLSATARQFGDCDNFVVFIGYPASGHTLLGSMLNAHPEMLVSNELDVLFYTQNGVPGRALLGAIAAHDAKFARKNRKNTKGYAYAANTSGLSGNRPIKTVGDKKGYPTARRLSTQPHLLDKLARRTGLPVKVLHLARNPYDMAASFRKWSGYPLTACTWQVAEMARLADCAARTIPAEDHLLVRFEDILATPERAMTRICAFLGRSTAAGDLAPALALVNPGHARPADPGGWDAEARREITAVTDRFAAFASYADDPRWMAPP